ncbi:MAG TPA: hypothetical protein VN380_26235 [Thermoanaerobaculia bacterium]|jgi:hypothetical protein|nr:hypothetical protein [Thermoanaerobaculia bacterium]
MESHLVFSRLPFEAGTDEYGPFHRLQCAHVNEKMYASGRIGGDRSYGVGFRRVHAYVGPLPDEEEGIEFWTKVPPDRGTPPQFAYWSDASDGVVSLDLGDREIVAIVATIVKRVDGYAYCRCKA